MDPDQQSKTDLQRLRTETETIGVEGRNWVVYSQLLLTMFLWGLAWPVGRLLATNLPPVSIAVLRYSIVVPVLFGILKVKGQSVRVERKWIVNFIVMGLFSTTLYQIFFLYGVRYAAASDDSLVIGIGPVLIAIMASFVLNERLTKTKGLGFISGLAGIGVISLLSPNTAVLNRLLGVSLVFGGAVAYAIHRYFEKVCGSKQSRQYESCTLITSDPRMDLSVWLGLSNSLIAVGGALDLQLESSLVAWSSLPRPPLNRGRVLLLCRRCL